MYWIDKVKQAKMVSSNMYIFTFVDGEIGSPKLPPL